MMTGNSNSPVSAVEQLQQGQEQYTGYFEGNSDSILIHDDSGNLIDANYVAMVQLFQNLMGNGIKYRGDKTPELTDLGEGTTFFFAFKKSQVYN